jgi:CRP-like cAMP-binding protein/CheY-like chemotaxis protein
VKKKILIIEDNTEVLENTAELLEIAGYSILTAENGKDGLESAKKNKPDLVLCDVMMPILDGYGVLRAFENIPEINGTPFVFITAKAEKADFRLGMDLGADDYLTKPFSGDDLLKVVAARLKKSQHLKKTFENNIDGLNNFLDTAKIQKGVTILSDKRTIKKVKKRDLLFMEGDTLSHLFFIVSGKIKTFKSNESGKDLIIDILKEGDFLGHVALLEDKPLNESAIAIEDSEVAIIPKEDFFQLLYSNNDVAITFIRLMSHNLSEAEDKLIKLAYDSARKRVAEAIIFVSKKYQTEDNKELSFSLLRENISALSGISPESVSRNLTDFKEEGLIETTNGCIKILNLKKLECIKN